MGTRGRRLQGGEQSSLDNLKIPFGFDGLLWAGPMVPPGRQSRGMQCLNPQRTWEYGQLGKRGQGTMREGSHRALRADSVATGRHRAGCPARGPICVQTGHGDPPRSSSRGFPREPETELWRWPPGFGLSRGPSQPWVPGSPLKQKQGRQDSCSLPGPWPGLRAWKPLLCECGVRTRSGKSLGKDVCFL